MRTRTKNKIWFVVGVALGVSIIGWGIAQKFLYPVEGNFNLATFAYVASGGFLIFMAWFARNFVDED